MERLPVHVLNMTGTAYAGTVFAPLDLGKPLVKRSMDYGIKNGYIVPPVLVEHLEVDLSHATIANGDYSESSLTKILSDPSILRRTAQMIAENLDPKASGTAPHPEFDKVSLLSVS
jgi:hypothetical protein